MLSLVMGATALLVPQHTSVVCVGGGVAGLRAAMDIASTGRDVLLVEASDGVGGRVRTDRVDGFLLDRGFQVFLDAYPESRAILDYKALRLHNFLPGARVQMVDARPLVADPLRKPGALISTLGFPIGSLADKTRLVLAVMKLKLSSIEELFAAPEVSTSEYLRDRLQLSPALVDGFFRPFFGGIFISSLEKQSSILFEFVLRMFIDGNKGDIALCGHRLNCADPIKRPCWLNSFLSGNECNSLCTDEPAQTIIYLSSQKS